MRDVLQGLERYEQGYVGAHLSFEPLQDIP
mgnify:CR=1 FL=1